ncbi:YppG family protein [Neobacillus fumarioli]|uniref:YppG family protein n=1 Tax=Neobacillus fumarioli TaxID=105229 RepID=UPI00082980E5|nr:YppG family protein [Neobacillus fumarioli]
MHGTMSSPFHNVNTGFMWQMMHQDPLSKKWNQQILHRQHPIGFPVPQHYSVYPQNPYPEHYMPFAQSFQHGFIPQTVSHQPSSQKDAQFLFHNPLQPSEEMVPKPYPPVQGFSVMNPYPKNKLLAKQPNGMQSLMNSFKSQDGTIDFNKMINTAGQMMNAVNQVSSLVKGFGGLFKPQ